MPGSTLGTALPDAPLALCGDTEVPNVKSKKRRLELGAPPALLLWGGSRAPSGAEAAREATSPRGCEGSAEPQGTQLGKRHPGSDTAAAPELPNRPRGLLTHRFLLGAAAEEPPPQHLRRPELLRGLCLEGDASHERPRKLIFYLKPPAEKEEGESGCGAAPPAVAGRGGGAGVRCSHLRGKSWTCTRGALDSGCSPRAPSTADPESAGETEAGVGRDVTGKCPKTALVGPPTSLR